MIIPRGTVLFSSVPFAHVLASNQVRCEYCFKESATLKKCGACKSVSYCGQNCQKLSWKAVHKIECKCLRRCTPKRPSQSVRLTLQLVLRCVNGEDVMKHDNLRCFKDLQTHAADIKSDMKRLEEFIQLCVTLKEYAGEVFENEHIVFPTSDQLLAIFGRLAINTFTICDAELNSIGAGIYLGPSILDHSCMPNCVPVFSGTRLTIRTIEDVEIDPDVDDEEEVSNDIVSEIKQRNYDNVNFELFRISYADLLSPASERNAHLRSCYYFECSCDRCQREREQAARLDIDARTNVDDETEKTDENDAHSLFKQLNEAEERNKANEVNEAARLCEQLVTKVERFRRDPSLSPYDTMYSLTTKCLDLQFDLLIKSGDFERAEQVGIDLLAYFRRILPRFDAHIGVHLAKLAKLSAHIGCLDTALQFYEAALSALDVSHGEKHAYVEHVRGQLYVPLLQELKQHDVRSSL